MRLAASFNQPRIPTRRRAITGQYCRQRSPTAPTPSSTSHSNYDNFQKQSTPPTLLAPANGTVFFDQPTFRWSPVLGARKYEFQVAQDPSFGSPIDDITTDATAYSSNTTYPADTILYWRVRAADENGIGLTWSATGTFQKTLASPVQSPMNPTAGESLPVWTWSSVNSAVSYDLAIDQDRKSTRLNSSHMSISY